MVVDVNPHSGCPFPLQGTHILLQTIYRNAFTGIQNRGPGVKCSRCPADPERRAKETQSIQDKGRSKRGGRLEWGRERERDALERRVRLGKVSLILALASGLSNDSLKRPQHC